VLRWNCLQLDRNQETLVGDQPESPQTLNENLVGSLAAGVLILDSRGEVRLANGRARALLGGPPAAESAAIGDGAAVGAVLAAAADASGAGRREVAVVVAGEPRVLGVQVIPLERDAGEQADVLLMLTDLTEVRAARGLATLAGIGRLTHHVAHELKNPLGALKLYTLLLERHLRDAKPDSRDLAEKIGRAIDHLAAVVGEVTAFGPAGSLERDRLAVGPLVNECLAAVAERAAAAGIEVIRRDEPGLAVRGDARALRQAVRAFIDNALDAMPGGGTLTVSVARGNERTVGITVEDSGAGLSPVAQAQLFEPFFTTRADKVGLGATIAGHIIEQHGGRIVVRSEPRVGTTIRIALPAD
jgi:two-component system, NtrC family, C4-dicarboxylate transport sensor histidine kinase DctB